MFAKVATAFGLFAIAAQVAVATPPACLIAAVNTQSDPSDVKTVCTSGASDVQSYMSDKCGDNLDAATSAWTSYCKDAGVTVSSSSSSSSSSASATGSSSSTASATGAHTSGTTHSITSAGYPKGTAGASSGFVTATTNMNGTYTAPSASGSAAAHSSSAPSGTSNGPSATSSGTITSTGAASRLGMDIVGLTAIGMFGAMLAM